MININGIDKSDRSILTDFHNRYVDEHIKPEDFASLVDQYGRYDFFSGYKEYLKEVYTEIEAQYSYFSAAVISYLRIINR